MTKLVEFFKKHNRAIFILAFLMYIPATFGIVLWLPYLFMLFSPASGSFALGLLILYFSLPLLMAISVKLEDKYKRTLRVFFAIVLGTIIFYTAGIVYILVDFI